jgi:hypothetical protein
MISNFERLQKIINHILKILAVFVMWNLEIGQYAQNQSQDDLGNPFFIKIKIKFYIFLNRHNDTVSKKNRTFT